MREFWIHDGFVWYQDPSLTHAPVDYKHLDFTHVIEYSAYTELEKRLAIATEALKGEIKILEAAGHNGSAFGLKVALTKIRG